MEIIDDLFVQFTSYYDKLIVLIPRVLIAVVVVGLFLFLMTLIRKRLKKFLESKADDKSLVNFFDKLFQIFNITIAILLSFYIVGLAKLAASALGGLGLGAIIVGFAFKDIAENLLAGVMMAFKRPFKVGDVIETQGIIGSVVVMNIRETHVKTFDGKDVYIPNGQILKNPLFNFTIDGFMRHQFKIGVDYNSDIERVRKIIMDVLMNVSGILKEGKMPLTMVSEFQSSTIEITVQYWTNTFDKSHSSVEIKTQAMRLVLEALQLNKVEMPSDIIEIVKSV
jgi:small-conductance mechanosensitive channel